MEWYGNGPKPDNKFYGILETSRRSGKSDLSWQIRAQEQKRRQELLEKYPNFAELDEELKHAEDDYLHRGIALDHLREEHELLKKLLGIE